MKTYVGVFFSAARQILNNIVVQHSKFYIVESDIEVNNTTQCIVAFPLQQWLHERAILLQYIVFLVLLVRESKNNLHSKS